MRQDALTVVAQEAWALEQAAKDLTMDREASPSLQFEWRLHGKWKSNRIGKNKKQLRQTWFFYRKTVVSQEIYSF